MTRLPHTAHAGPDDREVVLGVDTHADTHTAALVDPLGRLVAAETFPATRAGYRALLAWARGHGHVERAGVEGTGSYGAGLARSLARAGVEVVEVDRPDTASRRLHGKSDPLDAESAARAALSGAATTVPKDHDGIVEAIRLVHLDRADAVAARAKTQTRLRCVLSNCCDDALRERLHGLTKARLLHACAALRTDPDRVSEPAQAVRQALRHLARRCLDLTAQIRRLDKQLDTLTARANPALRALPGVGPETAAQLMVSHGEQPDRFHGEAAFARACGVAPIPASSGKTNRHRLNRGGDRQANRALHVIAITRLAHDQRTQAYVERRTDAGLAKTATLRCLKRYILREVYKALTHPHADTQDTPMAA